MYLYIQKQIMQSKIFKLHSNKLYYIYIYICIFIFVSNLNVFEYERVDL
jgi:hypothetical protein